MTRKIKVTLTILAELELTDEMIEKYYNKNDINTSINEYVTDYANDVDMQISCGSVNDVEWEEYNN